MISINKRLYAFWKPEPVLMGSRGTEMADVALLPSICMYIEFNNLIYISHFAQIQNGMQYFYIVYSRHSRYYRLHTNKCNILYGYDREKLSASKLALKTGSQKTE